MCFMSRRQRCIYLSCIGQDLRFQSLIIELNFGERGLENSRIAVKIAQQRIDRDCCP